MDFKTFQIYCMEKIGTTFDFPFDEKTMVFRLVDKMYALVNIENKELKVNLKCNPEIILDLRKDHVEIQPGYHMNKKHWNTVDFTGTVPNEKLYWKIDHSYDLVFSKLKKSDREKIEKGDDIR